MEDRHNENYKHINDDANRGDIKGYQATPGFQLQMIGNTIGGTDQRAYRHQMNSQNEKMQRRASGNENQYQIGDIGDAGKDARGGATRDLNYGPSGAGNLMKRNTSFNRENDNQNVDQQNLDMRQKFPSQRYAIDSLFQNNQKVHGQIHQQSKTFKQQPSLQSQNKKSNIYIIDFAQK